MREIKLEELEKSVKVRKIRIRELFKISKLLFSMGKKIDWDKLSYATILQLVFDDENLQKISTLQEIIPRITDLTEEEFLDLTAMDAEKLLEAFLEENEDFLGRLRDRLSSLADRKEEVEQVKTSISNSPNLSPT